MKISTLLTASAVMATLAIAPANASNQIAPAALSKAPVPLTFEGGHSLGVTVARQRILSQRLGYILTIGTDGEVTNCELTREFRYRATEVAMCRPFERHLNFEPALDENGMPTVGTYEFSIDINTFLTSGGDLRNLHR